MWHDCVCEGGFSVNEGHPVCGGPVDSNVQVMYFVIGFCFCSEFYVGVDGVEVVLYVVDVCVSGVINYQNVINLSKVTCNFILVGEVC